MAKSLDTRISSVEGTQENPKKTNHPFHPGFNERRDTLASDIQTLPRQQPIDDFFRERVKHPISETVGKELGNGATTERPDGINELGQQAAKGKINADSQTEIIGKKSNEMQDSEAIPGKSPDELYNLRWERARAIQEWLQQRQLASLEHTHDLWTKPREIVSLA